MNIVFDRVVIRPGTPRSETYSMDQFLALPLDARIKYILSRELEFFQGDVRVARADALRSLRPAAPSSNNS